MYLIQQITNDSLQKQTFVLPDGSTFDLTIRFVPAQLGWFIDELVYGSFTLNSVRITNSPNMIQQFKNQVPFGLACFSTADREPSQQNDFSSAASLLYILTAEEVAIYSGYIRGEF